MRSSIVGVALIGISSILAGQSRPAPEAVVRRDLSVLAADSMGGRFTGSPGGDAAARYLARRFGEIGAVPGVPGWLQEFTLAADLAATKEIPEAERPRRGANVVAVVRGRDRRLAEEYVAVGAHYDHLGHGQARSSALGAQGEIYNGADDNASGTVALLEIARRLVAAPPKRSVVLIAFSGEELGLLGSAAYVRQPAVPLDRTVAMINLDMVGRLRDDALMIFGSETAAEFPGLLDSLNVAAKFALKHTGDGLGRSDQQSFYLAGKPVLHVFTNVHEDYHRPSDDWEKVNVPGLVRVASYTTELVRAIADRPNPPALVSKPPAAHPPVAGSQQAVSAGYGAYLGSIPDMSVGGPGVRLSGVRAGSPADKAGLREGDVLLRIGTFEVGDLQVMTDALRAHRPGDTTVVRFRRGERVDSTSVVFGRRGG